MWRKVTNYYHDEWTTKYKKGERQDENEKEEGKKFVYELKLNSAIEINNSMLITFCVTTIIETFVRSRTGSTRKISFFILLRVEYHENIKNCALSRGQCELAKKFIIIGSNEKKHTHILWCDPGLLNLILLLFLHSYLISNDRLKVWYLEIYRWIFFQFNKQLE